MPRIVHNLNPGPDEWLTEPAAVFFHDGKAKIVCRHHFENPHRKQCPSCGSKTFRVQFKHHHCYGNVDRFLYCDECGMRCELVYAFRQFEELGYEVDPRNLSAEELADGIWRTED